MAERGLVHLYWGDGKGKTTAAMGLAVRMLGRGRRVLLLQFLKGNGSGERAALSLLPGFSALDGPDRIKFSVEMNETEREETRRLCRELLRQAEDRCGRGGCDLLILDEVCDAVGEGFLTAEQVADFIDRKPETLELVLTGHSLPPELAGRADYITEMKKVRHPYDRGVTARWGIEY